MSESPITIEPPRPLTGRPTGALHWALKAPLLAYRLGLGRLLPRPMLLLTTTGRRSGLPRTVSLESRRHGSKLYVVSVWGTRAYWYQNLLADPLVRLQIGGRSHAARAVPLTSADELWRVLGLYRKSNRLVDAILAGTAGISGSIAPDDLVDSHDRLAGVRFELLDASTTNAPPGLRADLSWLWGVLLATVLTVVAIRWQRRRD